MLQCNAEDPIKDRLRASSSVGIRLQSWQEIGLVYDQLVTSLSSGHLIIVLPLPLGFWPFSRENKAEVHIEKKSKSE